MDWNSLLYGIVDTVIYSIVGIIMMTIGFLIINAFTPFSIKKEIEDIHTLPPEASYVHGKRVFYETPHAEALYIPCAHFAVPYLQKLEDDIRVPVVTSTTAMIWYCFKILNIYESIKGHGTLLASLAK